MAATIGPHRSGSNADTGSWTRKFKYVYRLVFASRCRLSVMFETARPRATLLVMVALISHVVQLVCSLLRSVRAERQRAACDEPGGSGERERIAHFADEAPDAPHGRHRADAERRVQLRERGTRTTLR